MNLWNEYLNLGGINLHEINKLPQSSRLPLHVTQSQTLIVDSDGDSRLDMEGPAVNNVKVVVFCQRLAAHRNKEQTSQPVSPITNVPNISFKNQSLLIVLNELQDTIQ